MENLASFLMGVLMTFVFLIVSAWLILEIVDSEEYEQFRMQKSCKEFENKIGLKNV